MANRNISYQNRDFDGIKDRLINFSQTYFPTTYTDFDANSPGIMFMEQASYVSDVLSFYLDNQVQETYLQYARQDNNIYDLAYMFGYKPKLTGLASTDIDFYQLIPAKVVMGAAVPDYDYALQVGGETLVTSDNGTGFIIEDSIDFTVSNSMDTTEVSVAQIANNEPTYFLLKKTRKSNSGNLNSQNFNLGAYSEFPTIQINNGSLAKILSIVDSEGNNYSEVDNLAQDLVFIKQKNSNINDPNNFQNAGDTPYILQTKQTQYRFVTRHLNSRITHIQFGAGDPTANDEQLIPNLKNVGLGLPNSISKLNESFDPTNFLKTKTYGTSPSNTTMTVRYLVGGGVATNVSSGTLTTINSIEFEEDLQALTQTQNALVSATKNSIAVDNEVPATGGKGGDTIDEIRENALANLRIPITKRNS